MEERLVTLPEGEEHHRFDHQELQHGAVGAEQLAGGEVEEEEGVQRQANRDVVDDGHVQVTAGNAEEEETEKGRQLAQCSGGGWELWSAHWRGIQKPKSHPQLAVGDTLRATSLHYGKLPLSGNEEVLAPSALRNLLEVSVLVFAVGLQEDGDGGHERFDHTELQRSLLTEAQEPDGVGPSSQAARSVHAAGPGGQSEDSTEI